MSYFLYSGDLNEEHTKLGHSPHRFKKVPLQRNGMIAIPKNTAIEKKNLGVCFVVTD